MYVFFVPIYQNVVFQEKSLIRIFFPIVINNGKKAIINLSTENTRLFTSVLTRLAELEMQPIIHVHSSLLQHFLLNTLEILVFIFYFDSLIKLKVLLSGRCKPQNYVMSEQKRRWVSTAVCNKMSEEAIHPSIAQRIIIM